MKTTAQIAACILLALLQTARADGNLLADPGFEASLKPEDGGWILFDTSRFVDKASKSGSRSIFNWGFSRSIPYPPYLVGSAAGSYQAFPATPGSTWRLTGYGMKTGPIEGALAFGIVQLSFFDATGKDLGTVETAKEETTRAKVSNEVNSRSPDGEWILLDTGIATAPEGTREVHAFTLFVDYSAANRLQGVYFDDLRLCRTDDSGTCR